MCVDNNCDTSFIDRDYLTKKMLNYKKHVKKINVIKIRDIDEVNLSTIECLSIIFRIFDTIADDSFVVVIFIKHVYIVDDLKTKILLNNDIFESKQIALNIVKKINH